MERVTSSGMRRLALACRLKEGDIRAICGLGPQPRGDQSMSMPSAISGLDSMSTRIPPPPPSSLPPRRSRAALIHTLGRGESPRVFILVGCCWIQAGPGALRLDHVGHSPSHLAPTFSSRSGPVAPSRNASEPWPGLPEVQRSC